MTLASEQIQRLLALVPYLQVRPNARLTQVAEDFGVTAKQIRQDLEVLSWCGLPGLDYGAYIELNLSADTSHAETVTLSNADYLRRPLRLTSDEAASLLVAVRALLEVAGSSERPTVESVLTKLSAIAGPQAQLAGLAEVRVWRPRAEVTEVAQTGLSEKRQIRLVYEGFNTQQTTIRTVDPLRIRLTDGCVYLDAYCELAADLRSFRLDRVVSAELCDTPAQPHPNLILSHPDQPWHFAGAASVTLGLTPAGHWAVEYYPILGTARVAQDVLYAEFPVTSERWLQALLLRLADAVVSVVPSQAGVAAAAAATAALQLYQDSFGFGNQGDG